MGHGVIYHDFGKKTSEKREHSFSLHGLINGVCLFLCGSCIALSLAVICTLMG